MYSRREDVLFKRTSELKIQNLNLQREIQKQKFEIKKQEEIYQKEYKKLFELQLENVRIRKDIERIREINTNIKRNKEEAEKEIQKVKDNVYEFINEDSLQSPSQEIFSLDKDIKNIIEVIEKCFEKFYPLCDESTEEKWIETKDKLTEELHAKQMSYEDVVKKLENVKRKSDYRNPTGITGNIWDMLIEEIKQSIFVEWYEFLKENPEYEVEVC